MSVNHTSPGNKMAAHAFPAKDGSKPSGRSCLLELPCELRLEIFQHVFSVQPLTWRMNKPEIFIVPALMRTCHVIRDEASSIHQQRLDDVYCVLNEQMEQTVYEDLAEGLEFEDSYVFVSLGQDGKVGTQDELKVARASKRMWASRAFDVWEHLSRASIPSQGACIVRVKSDRSSWGGYWAGVETEGGMVAVKCENRSLDRSG
ncbi:hypothetical protein LTR94_011343 [Friedmanniomyces endolithicus]|nr:hypothetical protein LTR94_011343 [Friedmanniomyces endolithicus]